MVRIGAQYRWGTADLKLQFPEEYPHAGEIVTIIAEDALHEHGYTAKAENGDKVLVYEDELTEP